MRTFTHPLLATLPSVLLIGVESSARTRIHRILRRAKFRTFVCAQLRDALDLMHLVSVIVCHQPLPGIRWQDVLRQAEKLRSAPSVVVTIPRPLTIQLDEANQAGVFALLEPYHEAEVTALIQRAHAEYQVVRHLQSAPAGGLARLDQALLPAATGPADFREPPKWPESSTAVPFRAVSAPRRDPVPDPAKPVSVG